MLLLTALALCGAACQRREQLSGGGTVAIKKMDGTIVTRKATSDELAEVETMERKGAAVDEVFPRPEPPARAKLSKGVRVLPPGSVELTDGRIIRLDGVRCPSPLGLDYLSRILVGTDTFLLVIPTGEAEDHTVPADVWTVERSGTSVSYSSPAETAITSGWCDPERTITGRHTERYEALADAFGDERAKFSGDAH
jgi:hypothetical protein